MKKLILASASPRRREILENAGFDFEVSTSEVEETMKGLSPEKTAVANACKKAEEVFQRFSGKDAIVLGADTVVAFQGRIYGKPYSEEDAKKTLRELSGNTHEVITGYCIIADGMRECGSVVTKVTFNRLSESDIDRYIKSGLYADKAGSYGIQDGYGLIKEYSGDRDNVVGLPLKEIENTLKEFLK